MYFPQFNYKIVMITSICLLVFGVGFGFYAFPKLLRKMIKGQVNVAPGGNIRPLYKKTPFFIDFRIRLFNITNKEEILEGKKPKLQEIGPYFFEEWKEKFDTVDDDVEDTLTYHYRNKFVFRPDLSAPGLTGDEIVVLPHPLIMGMYMATNVDKAPMLPMLEGVIKNLFNDPADAFFTGRAMDILFDGVPVDCSSDDATTQAVCLQLGEKLPKIDDDHLAFSLFGVANYTDLGEFKVYRGKKNSYDVGRVISFNGETEMSVWEDDECNTYVGTNSPIFSSWLNPEDGLWAYEPSVCRSLGATYTSRKTKYNGIPVLVYEMDLGAEVNKKQCFCRDIEDVDSCPQQGTFDLFRCAGIPMFGSLPHFYKADPKLLDGFESGLYPNQSLHEIELLFEIMTGSPLSAAKRLQFNLEVKNIPNIKVMEKMPDLLLTLFWVEEGVNLGRDFTDKIKNTLFLVLAGALMVMNNDGANKVMHTNMPHNGRLG